MALAEPVLLILSRVLEVRTTCWPSHETDFGSGVLSPGPRRCLLVRSYEQNIHLLTSPGLAAPVSAVFDNVATCLRWHVFGRETTTLPGLSAAQDVTDTTEITITQIFILTI